MNPPQLENAAPPPRKAAKQDCDVFDLAPIGMFRMSREGVVLFANPALARDLGFASASDIVGLDVASAIVAPGFEDALRTEIRGTSEDTITELRLKHQDGTSFWARIRIRTCDDRAWTHVGFIRDVDGERAVVEKLRHSEERFRQSFQISPVAMGLQSEETWRFIDVNEAFVRALGYPREALVGKTAIEVGFWPDPAARQALLDTIDRGGSVRELEVQVRARSGEIKSILLSMERFEIGDDRVFMSVLQDVTARRRAEQALKENEERFRSMIETSRDVVTIVDPDGTLTYANPSLLHVVGYRPEEVIGRNAFEFVHPDDIPELKSRLFAALVGQSRPGTTSYRFRHKDGSWRHLEAVASNRAGEVSTQGIVHYSRDVTERKLAEESIARLEDKVRQIQKMEAVGRLAGGIAHDFNNLLTAILGYAALLGTESAQDEGSMASIGEIRKAAERAASLTHQLLAFSRQQILEPKVIDVNALIENVEKMLSRVIGEQVVMKLSLDPRTGRVRADAGQLEQVVINLAVNARDAMPSGGRLTIETAMVDLDGQFADKHVTVVPGPHVAITVSDTGTGMDAATRSRIFEPFFTTKENGKGTGLGLATAYGIVKQSGGSIWCYSEPGQGSIFKVFLPRVEDAATSIPVPNAQSTESLSGSETILLVEDEEGVRRLTSKILRSRGYRVLEASNGPEALEVARQESGIHLLLTDVVMPGMTGPELADQLTSKRSDLRVLLMSGYTNDAIVQAGLSEPGRPLLQKPFTPAALARTVRAVLTVGFAGAPPPAA